MTATTAELLTMIRAALDARRAASGLHALAKILKAEAAEPSLIHTRVISAALAGESASVRTTAAITAAATAWLAKEMAR